MEPTIHIFKTNIKRKKDIQKITPLLTRETITQWNIDHADADCVLRVVTPSLSTSDIITLLTNEGYHCSELNN